MGEGRGCTDHEERPDARAHQRPNDGRADAVDRAFGDEHLHELASAHPDGAGHAHLRFPLRRQHLENEEDEQYAHANREETEEREDRDEERADQVGKFDEVLLERRELKAVFPKERMIGQAFLNLGGEADALVAFAQVRDHHRADQALLPRDDLSVGQRRHQDQPVLNLLHVVGLGDRLDGELFHLAGAHRNADDVAGFDADLLGPVSVDIDLIERQGTEVDQPGRLRSLRRQRHGQPGDPGRSAPPISRRDGRRGSRPRRSRRGSAPRRRSRGRH